MSPINLLTPSLLHSIRTQPALPQNIWHIIAPVTLSVLNRPSEIPGVFRYAIENLESDNACIGHTVYSQKLKILRNIREALIKSACISGLPKTINALMELQKGIDPELANVDNDATVTKRINDVHDVPSAKILSRGDQFFDKIYGKISRRVMKQLDSCGTPDLAITTRLMYGHILSNMEVLDSAQTSFVMLASLIPQDVNAQLKGHMIGATHHDHVTADQIHAARAVILRICEASGMRRLHDADVDGWGWRGPIADV